MGRVLDGVSDHMENFPENQAFRISAEPEADRNSVIASLKQYEVDVLVNFLPVGSEQATLFYVECAFEAGVSLVNGIPVAWSSRPSSTASMTKLTSLLRCRMVPLAPYKLPKTE